jgi:transcriptional regulator with XRE-family HTH domain
VKEKTRVYVPYHRTTSAQRAQWVRQFQASGLSQRDFAARHGMGLSTLAKWLQKENLSPARNSDSPPWREVILPAAPGPGWVAEIAFQDGSLLRLSTATAAGLLPAWLDARS